MSSLRNSEGEREIIKGRVDVVPCARFSGRGKEQGTRTEMQLQVPHF